MEKFLPFSNFANDGRSFEDEFFSIAHEVVDAVAVVVVAAAELTEEITRMQQGDDPFSEPLQQEKRPYSTPVIKRFKKNKLAAT